MIGRQVKPRIAESAGDRENRVESSCSEKRLSCVVMRKAEALHRSISFLISLAVCLVVMRSQVPLVDSDIWGSLEIRCCHSRPLRVNQNLVARISSLWVVNDQDSHTGQWRVTGRAALGDGGVFRGRRRKGCGPCSSGGSGQNRGHGSLRVEDKGGSGRVDGDGCVGVSSPLDVGTRWDTGNVVLNQELFSVVDVSDSSFDGATSLFSIRDRSMLVRLTSCRQRSNLQ